jgi:MYXO-CTERM domain-containing protein
MNNTTTDKGFNYGWLGLLGLAGLAGLTRKQPPVVHVDPNRRV